MTTRAANNLIAKIAGLTKDGECVNCGTDGDEPNPKCSDHKPFDLPSDDAVETLHSLISEARRMSPAV